jgi:hypothetical protein
MEIFMMDGRAVLVVAGLLVGGHFGKFSFPAAARNEDGRAEIFAVGSDGILYHRWQESNGVWKVPWKPLSGPNVQGWPSGISVCGVPKVASNQDGRLEIFVKGCLFLS